MRRLVTLLALLTQFAWAQDTETRNQYRYPLSQTNQPIRIDGLADDIGWKAVKEIPYFMNHWPLDSGKAEALTQIKVTYDPEYLYVLAICFDNGKRVVQSLRRDDDEGHWQSDNFTVVIDPMNTKQNGFMFGINAGGAQIEAQLTVDGAQTEYDQNWDNKWLSQVRRYENYWVAELAIPFKTLRYSPNVSEWGINFIRGDMERNIYSTWTQFPLNYGGIDLNYMGTLQWDKKPAKAAGRVVLIPYLTGGTHRDLEAEEGSTDYEENGDTGFDAKISLTGSLNLDLTVNPDFSNVDVDQQVTNLSRFSVFFPERRNFFLENGDIFSNFGSWQISPFFSRRIGLVDGEQVPITYGARLTGNVTNTTRVGAMNVQTRAYDTIATQNYTVAAVHQQVLDRSVVKAIFINRSAGEQLDEGQFARNGGVEFAYISKNGKFQNTARYHQALTDEHLADNHYYGFSGNFDSKKVRSGWTVDAVGENYITELGFNPRLENYNAETEESERIAYTRINPWVVYRFYPKEGKLNAHGPVTWHQIWLNRDGSGLNERRHGFAYFFNFKNTAFLRPNMIVREVNLPVPTSLVGGDYTPLPADNYRFTRYGLFFNSDRRKVLSAEASAYTGEFFNGKIYSSSTTLNYRVQPWGNFGITYEFNRVELPGEYGQTSLHLLRTNVQVNFSNTMFLTSALQFNSQDENYNFFTRFQWRYRPMSDLFLVYTDNYEQTGLALKNRQVVFKATYWLNL